MGDLVRNSRSFRDIVHATPGFLPEVEGEALADAARRSAGVGPLLEVGSYCGLSALYLGRAARAIGTVLFSIDHHRGSEEQQPGEEYFDRRLTDAEGRVDTLPRFRQTLTTAALEDVVVAIVGRSETVAAHWRTPLGLVFIDGGHSARAAHSDYEGWTRHVAEGGRLAIHDVFPDPRDGGRPPYEVYLRALADGYEEETATGSLRVLTRPARDRSRPRLRA